MSARRNAFIVQGEADESAQAAEQAQVEAAELLDRLRGRDGDVASVEASRDEALRRARSAGGALWRLHCPWQPCLPCLILWTSKLTQV